MITIRVSCSPDSWKGISELLRLLGTAFDAQFEWADEAHAQMDDQILLSFVDGRPDGKSVSFEAPFRSADTEGPKRVCISFTSNVEVPAIFRGRSITTSALQPAQPASGAKVLARSGDLNVWTCEPTAAGIIYRSAYPLPQVSESGTLHESFNGDRFIDLLPLVHWVRGFTRDSEYKQAPLRACFMFDDPNLHWLSYGYVDYRKILKDSERHNFHVSFATIPIDSWYTHQGAADLFRNNSDRLSLLVHGNNHTKLELGRNYSARERSSLLRQSIQRIEKLERNGRIKVCRVMVPPHGACSDAMLNALPSFGFRGACVSHGSLIAHNRGKQWTRTIGLAPAEFVEGCAVMPRWNFNGDAENRALLAAYLNQPLIFRGHHDDLGKNPERLNELAGIINKLGTVLWGNTSKLAKTGFGYKLRDGLLEVWAYSQSVSFVIPETVSSIVVHCSPGTEMDLTASSNVLSSRLQHGVHQELATRLDPGTTLKFKVSSESKFDSQTAGRDVPINPWPRVRRLLTEVRDRVSPIVRS